MSSILNHRINSEWASAVQLARLKAPTATVMGPVADPIMLDANLGENAEAALRRLTEKLGPLPLSGQRVAVVTGNDFIPSELREYAYLVRNLGGQVDFVTDRPKTLASDLNGGKSIQQLEVRQDVREVAQNLGAYAAVIVGANYTSKNLSGGPLNENPLFQLVDQVLQRGDTVLGLNCHALWALMGAKAISKKPEHYRNLSLTFNTVLEPEARALGYADARKPGQDMHDFAVTDRAHHLVSSSAGVGNGTVRLVEELVLEVARIRRATPRDTAFEALPTGSAGSTLAPAVNETPVPQRLMLGKEMRELTKAPAVTDPRRFDAPLGGDVDAVVSAVRTQTGRERPLQGKKIAVVVEALFNATELRQYAHVLGDLGAQVIYTSRLWDVPGGLTFESSVSPASEKIYQLQVGTEAHAVTQEIQNYAAVIVPDGNVAKRLSYRPDDQPFEANPFLNLVSSALGSPATDLVVSGRGLWGLVGTATLSGAPHVGKTVAVSPEMRPDAIAAGLANRSLKAEAPGTTTRIDARRGIVSTGGGADTLPMVQALALRLAAR